MKVIIFKTSSFKKVYVALLFLEWSQSWSIVLLPSVHYYKLGLED